MPTVDRAQAMGKRNAMKVRQRLADELRGVRLAAGASQSHVANSAGISQSQISRIELAQASGAAIDDIASHCAALGLRLDVRTFPIGSPVRDAGQLRLIDRLRPQVHEDFASATEVLVGEAGDQRAWDVLLSGPGTIGDRCRDTSVRSAGPPTAMRSQGARQWAQEVRLLRPVTRGAGSAQDQRRGPRPVTAGSATRERQTAPGS